jgi:integrase
MARYTMQTPTGPKCKTIYGKKREDVADELARALANRADRLIFDDEKITVGEYVTRWLEDSAKGDLAPRTYHNYRLQVRRHIVPALGRTKLKVLSPVSIQSLYAAKLRDGMKPSSVRYIHAVLHRAMEQAVRWNMIARNPARAVDPPKVRQEEITPLDPKQARWFLEAAKVDRFECLYILSLTCGLRMGEALGLKWSDIDFDAGTLRVNRQLQRIREGGRLVFSEPKNASRRTIDLPQKTVEALRIHRKQQAEEKLRGPVPTKTQDLFLVLSLAHRLTRRMLSTGTSSRS